MIVCPRCRNTLPPSAIRCQFCGTDVSRVPRPAGQYYGRSHWANEPLSWQLIVGNVLGVLWILYGAVILAAAIVVTRAAESGTFADQVVGQAMAGVGFCIGVFGSVYVLIGVGILLKWSWVPTAIYIVCGLTIFHRLVVLLQLAGAAAPAVPEARTIEVALSILAIIVAGFQIYIISATRDAY